METDPLSQIEALCAANGRTLSAVLDEAGVAASTWWRWKEGRFDPRQSTLRRIWAAAARKAAADKPARAA